MNKKVIIALSVVILVIIGVLVYIMKPEELKQYTVTFTYGNGTTTEVTIKEGNIVEKPVEPTMTGYKFVGWELNGVSYDFTTPITGDMTLVAKYEKIEEEKPKAEYTVKFDVDGGSTVVDQKVKEGEKVEKPEDPAKTGHVFEGWTLNGEKYDFASAVTGNITLVATWKKTETVTVTFNTDGGSSVASQTIEKGKTATKPSNPTKTGYKFKEWTLNGKAYDFNTKLDKNITLKATWEKIEYVVVTFDTDGGSNVASQKIEKGMKATKPTDPTRTGYRFKGWELNGTTYNFSAAVNSNITIKAVWEKVETVTITFNTDGGSSITAQTIEKGKTATKPTNPTKDGYTFTGWTLNGTTYNFSSAVNSNITLKATWTQKTFTAKITTVDNYSTDRYITIYQEGTPITVSGIYYTSGTRIPTAASGNKLTVAAAEIEGVTTIKVKLTSGSMVTATIQ